MAVVTKTTAMLLARRDRLAGTADKTCRIRRFIPLTHPRATRTSAASSISNTPRWRCDRPPSALSDGITHFLGSGLFLIFHVVWFAFWILAGLEAVPGLPKFDQFPFGLLTMIVSLEAIFLAIVVLISQNRMSRLADRRAHLDLQNLLPSKR